MATAEVAHGRLPHANPCLPLKEVCQGQVRPVGTLDAASPGALSYPVQNRGRQLLGNEGRLARSPLNLQPFQAPSPVAGKEALDVARRRPQVLGNLLLGTAPGRHQYRLAPVAQSAVLRRAEARLQLAPLLLIQLQPAHAFSTRDQRRIHPSRESVVVVRAGGGAVADEEADHLVAQQEAVLGATPEGRTAIVEAVGVAVAGEGERSAEVELVAPVTGDVEEGSEVREFGGGDVAFVALDGGGESGGLGSDAQAQ
ncbi:MAG TPA: hypothetical protein VEZ71_01090, partial [Archangium sp.]|nr:hypothetical protein [Archangium sp.]